jgi:hypothetical protein
VLVIGKSVVMFQTRPCKPGASGHVKTLSGVDLVGSAPSLEPYTESMSADRFASHVSVEFADTAEGTVMVMMMMWSAVFIVD